MLAKMETAGVQKSVVGLVIPTGYSFNLDGTSIYLTMAAVFIAQATNSHLDALASAHLVAGAVADLEGRGRCDGQRFYRAGRHFVRRRPCSGRGCGAHPRNRPLHVGSACTHQSHRQRRGHDRRRSSGADPSTKRNCSSSLSPASAELKPHFTSLKLKPLEPASDPAADRLWVQTKREAPTCERSIFALGVALQRWFVSGVAHAAAVEARSRCPTVISISPGPNTQACSTGAFRMRARHRVAENGLPGSRAQPDRAQVHGQGGGSGGAERRATPISPPMLSVAKTGKRAMVASSR